MTSCYYQITRLIKLTNEELHRYFLHEFVSTNWKGYKEQQPSDEDGGDIICKIAHEYQLYLRHNEDNSNDEFMKMACLFLHMSDDFFFLFNLTAVEMQLRLSKDTNGLFQHGRRWDRLSMWRRIMNRWRSSL